MKPKIKMEKMEKKWRKNGENGEKMEKKMEKNGEK